MFLNDKKIIGQKIKAYRKNAGYTQAELAEKIGVSEKHLSKIETGLHYPSISVFWDACMLLKIPMSEFGINLITKMDSPLRTKVIKDIYMLDESELEVLSILMNSVFKNFTLKKRN